MLGSNFRLLCQLPNPISGCPLSFLESQVWAARLPTAGSQPERRLRQQRSPMHPLVLSSLSGTRPTEKAFLHPTHPG